MKDGAEQSETVPQNGINAGCDKTVEIWREAMAQLRQTHLDVWNGLKFFLTANAILIAGILGVVKFQRPAPSPLETLAPILLAVVGIVVTLVALSIFSKQREYYLGVLLRKSLLEKELGLYESAGRPIDLSLPWKIEKTDLDGAIGNPSCWVSKQKFRTGTISRKLWLVYWGTIVVYVLLVAVTASQGAPFCHQSAIRRNEAAGLGIAKLVSQLRIELETADRERIENGKPPLLRLGQVELDLSFSVRRSAETGAKANIEVIEVGQTASFSKEEIQRLKVTWLQKDDEAQEPASVPPTRNSDTRGQDESN